mmetsp:Transcript_33850/g.52717  ORF Transcript_33850/g.52717 Transcript_33850/m.52717 type:complete len:263 (+) Transcript_33850:141-929(+)
MPIPRREGYVIKSNDSFDLSTCGLTCNILQLDKEENSQEAYASLAQAFEDIEIRDSRMADSDREMENRVLRHPMFREALQEYEELLSALLPTFESPNHQLPFDIMDLDDPDRLPDPELDSALEVFTDLTRRRKEKVKDFYKTLNAFLQEYVEAVDDLAVAEPLLKGTHLHQKIQDLKENVKRKFGPFVDELQKECVNKRRRANLPDKAVQIFKEWFRNHNDYPYPTEQEKASLAKKAGVNEVQVSNWFINVRKRYWKPHADS